MQRFVLLAGLSLAAACTPPVCEDSCSLANDGECDDGASNSVTGLCSEGTDCGDCGPRNFVEATPTAPVMTEDRPFDPAEWPDVATPGGDCPEGESFCCSEGFHCTCRGGFLSFGFCNRLGNSCAQQIATRPHGSTNSQCLICLDDETHPAGCYTIEVGAPEEEEPDAGGGGPTVSAGCRSSLDSQAANLRRAADMLGSACRRCIDNYLSCGERDDCANLSNCSNTATSCLTSCS